MNRMSAKGLKNLASRTIGIGVCAACLTTLQPAAAEPFEYLTQAVTQVVAEASLINLSSFDYLPGNSIFGAYVQTKDSISLRVNLEQGKRYLVLAAADNDVADLDLSAATTASGTRIAVDNAKDATPVLDFRPTQSGKITLSMKNYDASNNGFCAMVILQETGGGSFSLKQISEGLANALQNSRAAGLFASQFAQNCFCMFGGKLGSGQEDGLFNASIATGKYVLVTSGSNNVRDIDSYVVRQNNANETDGVGIAQDASNDSMPVCTFDTQNGNFYYFRHKNFSSTGNGFVFSVLLKI